MLIYCTCIQNGPAHFKMINSGSSSHFPSEMDGSLPTGHMYWVVLHMYTYMCTCTCMCTVHEQTRYTIQEKSTCTLTCTCTCSCFPCLALSLGLTDHVYVHVYTGSNTTCTCTCVHKVSTAVVKDNACRDILVLPVSQSVCCWFCQSVTVSDWVRPLTDITDIITHQQTVAHKEMMCIHVHVLYMYGIWRHTYPPKPLWCNCYH